MDNLAHALVGAALGRAVADRHVARAGLIGIIAANAPDLTELFIGLPGSRSDYLVLHRGVTHSLIGALVETLGLTLLAGGAWRAARWWVGRRPNGRVVTVPGWHWLAACIGLAVLSHLYLDWQGSYGWRPFLPWSNRWYYLDWVAIADPFFWLVPLIALAWGTERHWIPLAALVAVGGTLTFFVSSARDFVAPWVPPVYAVLCVVAVVGWIRYWFGPVERRRAAAYALVALAVYAGAQGVASAARKQEIRRLATARFGKDAQWAALPNVGRPFTWEAIYAGADTVAGADWALPRRLRDRSVVRALETPEGRAMAQFARFLTAEVDTTERTVYLRDARYARGGSNEWAVVRVSLDRDRGSAPSRGGS
jgi:inner membrane protein